MFIKRNILSLATLLVGASASGIFRQFGDKITQQANPCHITCPREYAPVCATDAETYENLCLFGVAKCMNRDLQLVANVTCPDLLIHLTHLAQKGMVESMNAIDSTYQTFGNITKGTAEMISSTLDSVPLIKLPNFNLPIFGIPPIPPQVLKTTSTSTSTSTTTTTTTSTSTSTTENTSTNFESDSSSESTSEYTSTSTSTSSTITSDIEPTSTSTSTSASTSTSTSTSASTSALPTSTTTIATSTKSSRKLIEIPSLEQGASGVIAQVTKTIQSALSGSGVSGSSPTTSSSAALGLNNLDDARTTIEGMVKTIPYTPGKNSSNILLVDGVSQIVKLPNGKESKNLLSNITSTESFNLPNITNLTNGSLSNITEKITSRNITLNGENLISNPNFQSLRNLTSSTLDNNNISNTTAINGTNSGLNINGTSLLTDSKFNKLVNGRFNTTDIFKGIGNTINNITKNIKEQVENEIENIN
ncbi:extracellular protein with a signal peptide, kazal domain and mucin like low complexity repeats [Cryptosporidium parvum Iowa II]|uniref:Extracellular protein with a signal peptide, kazal domain and mucin like low complexity repeats n=1 Tax=Cryptosporidium parvum (strain Iowa II) TaxID=353152 RepID=Q5CVA2_CRYPI|nr:extracellular protein with a signal peptide, kazal domain and mucin like low complexity repeats [Cryptosporidium parvum Iowa II]EAK89616.1 extracellular protein with a signal peptide, kazal domain and mucin like low complexity repeats [Cryptosporidium parvum Iowa II]WKS79749.1 signal peptide-containing protein [Cryptosporidium sp. 43IA8]WRK34249.1 Signal peptide,Kazal-type serine protease inhibitor domain containing protein [Cryptosporidium parvum]